MSTPPDDAASTPPTYDTVHIISHTSAQPPQYDGTVLPRESRALTTHTYSLNPQSHTTVTLVIKTSHSPSPTNIPLFFNPGVVAGEVQLQLDRKAPIKNISVYVRIL